MYCIVKYISIEKPGGIPRVRALTGEGAMSQDIHIGKGHSTKNNLVASLGSEH
jgi:hypothetical protein